jgi:glycosyltransferase involved in cell wall biosynthesis
VRALAARGEAIDLVVADDAAAFGADRAATVPSGVHVVSAAECRARGSRPDLAVYYLANDAACEFMWSSVFDQPGLLVLHDVNIHAMRRAGAPGRAAGYRTEFAANHPDVPPDAAELAIAGFAGAYESFWPMIRSVVEASRAVAVPAAAAARDVQARWPDASIVTITPGIQAPAPSDADTRMARRSALNIPAEAVVFGVVGNGDGPAARRLPQILRAFASTLARVPHVRLLMAGMESDLAAQPLAVRNAITRVGPATEEERGHLMDAVDVLVDLHWPPSAGPSDPWLAAMAAGRLAIVMDTVESTDLPALDPRSWRPPVDGRDPVGVAIDILDEDHSLRLACYRLAVDHALRERLGRAAHTYWERTHTLGHMTAGVVRAIDLALARPVNRALAHSQLHQPEGSVMQEPTC